MVEELEVLDAAMVAAAAAARELEVCRVERNAAIGAVFRAGVPIGAIVERTGLSRTAVQDILGNPFGKVGRPPVRGR